MLNIRNLLSIAFLFNSGALAKDITPQEKLGQLEVRSVDVSKLDPDFDLKNFSMSFEVDGKKAVVELDRANIVAAGTGCLQFEYKDSSYKKDYRAVDCNVTIQEKKLTTIQLAAIKYSWNPQNFEVDFGPSPKFSMGQRSGTGSVKNYHTSLSDKEQPTLLLSARTLKALLQHPHPGDIHTKTTQLAPGDLKVENLNPNKELRATVHIDFIDGKPTYPDILLKNQLVAAYWNTERNEKYSHTPPSSGISNHYRFANKGVSESAHAYPLKKGLKDWHYEVSINEHVIRPALAAGQITRIPVATLNVHDYRSNIPGTFKVYSDKKQVGVLEEHLHPKNHAVGSYETWLEETFFPTRTSLFFPIGYNFRLDFYAIDDLGRNTLQDQILVDLTKE